MVVLDLVLSVIRPELGLLRESGAAHQRQDEYRATDLSDAFSYCVGHCMPRWIHQVIPPTSDINDHRAGMGDYSL
jgi:hypothetical protein